MNDELLTLYYFNDGLTGAERQAVADAIAANPAVAERFRRLCRDLDGLADTLDSDSVPPAPDMVERWHAALDRAADRAPAGNRPSTVHPLSFLLGALITAALVIGIGIGVWIGGDGPEPGTATMIAAPEPAPADREARFARGLQVHLRDTGRELATLPAIEGNDRQALIMNIIEQNRFYEQAAEQNDAERLARVLRAFELVLMRLASEDLPPAEAADLQARLQFEMNVILTKIANRASNEPDTI